MRNDSEIQIYLDRIFQMNKKKKMKAEILRDGEQ